MNPKHDKLLPMSKNRNVFVNNYKKPQNQFTQNINLGTLGPKRYINMLFCRINRQKNLTSIWPKNTSEPFYIGGYHILIPPHAIELTYRAFRKKPITEQFSTYTPTFSTNRPLENYRQDKSLIFTRNTKYGVLLKFNLGL